MLASEVGNTDVVALLINAGADKDAQDEVSAVDALCRSI
jgi:hypothetical protein